MGLYSTIICKYKLPMPEDPKGFTGSKDFQTKDLDQDMEVYEIDQDGLVFKKCYEYKTVPGNPKGKSLFDRLDSFEAVKEWAEPLKRTFSINIYDYVRSKTEYDYTIEYSLEFIDGKLSKSSIVSFEASLNNDRKAREVQWKKETEIRLIFCKTKRYRFLYKPWNQVCRGLFKVLHKASSKISNILWKIEHFLIV